MEDLTLVSNFIINSWCVSLHLFILSSNFLISNSKWKLFVLGTFVPFLKRLDVYLGLDYYIKCILENCFPSYTLCYLLYFYIVLRPLALRTLATESTTFSFSISFVTHLLYNSSHKSQRAVARTFSDNNEGNYPWKHEKKWKGQWWNPVCREA